jgi:type II secretory pathway pseudopilin PulG
MSRNLPAHQQAAPVRNGQARQRGYSLFEFGVAAAIVAILVGIVANRLNMYQQQLESVAAEQLISTLRVALQLRVSQLYAAQRNKELLTIADENPIGWLSAAPENYLGEYYSPDNKKFTPGSWYFDRREKTLVYLLIHQNSFAFRSSILLKFKVESPSLSTQPSRLAQSASIENVALVQVFDQQSSSGQ